MKKNVLRDFDFNQMSIGDTVAFIANQKNAKGFYRSSIQIGEIRKITEKSAEIFVPSLEKSFRLMKTEEKNLSKPGKNLRLRKAALYANNRAKGTGPKDAVGNTVNVGDVAAYMEDVYHNVSEKLIKGEVTGILGSFIEIDGKRKRRDKVVVLN